MYRMLKKHMPVKWKLFMRYMLQPSGGIFGKSAKYVYMDFGNYGNAGDNAIGISTLDFLRKNVSADVAFFGVTEFYENIKGFKKYIKPDTVIILGGGGNMGVQYHGFERRREMVCFLFRNNPIVVFPQTVDFGDLSAEANRLALRDAVKIYSGCTRLTMCAREKDSYGRMKKFFANARVLLAPDIVLRYQPGLEKLHREHKCVFCFRSDAEKIISDDAVEGLKELAGEHGYAVEMMDTHDRDIHTASEQESIDYVNAKLRPIATAETVFTDRLHGMIFSYLAKVPCVVFSNYNHKVKGVYEWIKDCGFVFMAEGYDEAKHICKDIIWKHPLDKKTDIITDEHFRELTEALKEYDNGR